MEKSLNITILLVDDNEDIIDFLTDELSDFYQVFKASNGREAMEELRNQRIHLVISDVMMPEMDGFQLCHAIKSSVDFSHIPVILLTAKNTLQSKIEGLELGADAYVEKPFSPEFLLAQVSNLIKNRDKVKAYFASSPLLHVKTTAHSKADELFLEKLQEIIIRNLSDPDLDVDQIAENMHMSRPTLYRKIKSISDLSPNELINLARLKKAAELLNDGVMRIYEIAELVGYSSQTQFGRNFSKQFGMSPTDYLNQRHADKKKT